MRLRECIRSHLHGYVEPLIVRVLRDECSENSCEFVAMQSETCIIVTEKIFASATTILAQTVFAVRLRLQYYLYRAIRHVKPSLR